jgi:hypothetical protein
VGFAFPWDGWLRGPLRERARSALENEKAWTAVGFDPGMPSLLWARFLNRDPRVVALQIIALWVLVEHVRRTGLHAA